ncbi:rhamnosyltransferase [Vibrio crassostreae]|nr:rhamnosyltransferase [Vibrio crassostreae]CAK3199904.1 rhamnosyltransferase [Vibrio crassostreae]CAK3236794.1 rhamnosyltransferase [Vibrio crassostreae]CAK3237295.1 rhamnosyltransferase [Vibrio crassostreae]CAK3304275.1 rhamnosyltransferase [Vibrio crassostreae]
MDNNKFGAVVVIYNPDSNVENNIIKLSEQVDQIVVVDNSDEKNGNHKILFGLFEEIGKKISYIDNGSNLGIAEALNVGIEFLKREQIDYILTFDQDSVITPGYLKSIHATFVDLSRKETIGVVGPNIVDVNSEKVGQKYLTTSSRWRFNFGELNFDRCDLGFVITSGSLFPVTIFDQVGLFKSEYFIDAVDIEYCLRLKVNGYRVGYSNEARLSHSLGEKTTHTILRKNIITSNHNFIRRYYVARNSIYILKEYGFKYPFWFLFDLAVTVVNATRVVCFEKNRSIKVKYSVMGYWHGLKGITGKLIERE